MKAIRKSDPECSQLPLVTLLADGELELARALEMELHVSSCRVCEDELGLLKAMRKSMRRSTVLRAPQRLRENLQHLAAAWPHPQTQEGQALGLGIPVASIGESQDSLGRVDPTIPSAPKKLNRKWAGVPMSLAMAMSAAACFALGYYAVRAPAALFRASKGGIGRAGAEIGATSPLVASASAFADSLGLDSVIDQLVSLHANPIPPETTDPNELKNFDPYVGVPVRRPRAGIVNANFLGARMHALRDAQRTAALEYKVNGHRMTVYVFDSRLLRLTPRALRPRVVESRPVFVGNVRGYSVAAAEARGVGYALASDMDEDKSAQAVAAFY